MVQVFLSGALIPVSTERVPPRPSPVLRYKCIGTVTKLSSRVVDISSDWIEIMLCSIVE